MVPGARLFLMLGWQFSSSTSRFKRTLGSVFMAKGML